MNSVIQLLYNQDDMRRICSSREFAVDSIEAAIQSMFKDLTQAMVAGQESVDPSSFFRRLDTWNPSARTQQHGLQRFV
jgi:hypothetical protein